jgi:putative FmdB family regulatory protein
MPLYEYECTACHRRTEKIQKFSDPEITVCPHCSGLLERVLSAPAIAFKGGGWYADGYGNAKQIQQQRLQIQQRSFYLERQHSSGRPRRRACNSLLVIRQEITVQALPAV